VGALALELLDPVVIGKSISKPLVSSIVMPTRFSSQPGIIRSSPITSGSRSADPPSNGSPSIVPTNLTAAMSPLAAARSSDGPQGRLLFAQVGDHGLDLLVGDLDGSRLNG
jgi:hypothetical protein